MEQVVGLTVLVKVKHPPNTIVYGIVQDAVPNSHLALRNVFFPASGERWPQYTLQLALIDDLEVVDPSRIPPLPQHAQPPPQQSIPPIAPQHTLPFRAPPPPHLQPGNGAQSPPQQPPMFPPSQQQPQQPLAPAHAHPRPAPTQQPPPESATPKKQQTSAFVDPAILSFGTPSVPVRRSPSRNEFETPIKSMLARAAQNLPSPSSPFIGDAGRGVVAQKSAAAAKSAPPIPPPQLSAKQSQPSQPAAAATEDAGGEAASKKKKQRSKKKDNGTAGPADPPPPVMNVEVSRSGNDMNGSVKRGKGWRNTPLLQPSPQASSAAETSGTKKNKRRKDREQEFAQGDTTDIQDMGDFDFEGELKKFDKKQVFDEIRQGDTTADEDRLVSHNRIHRPGTYGGKNLHPTEPVLSPKLGPKPSANELDSSSDADTELNFPNGRSSSRHSISRSVLSKKQGPSRQNSAHVEQQRSSHPHPLHPLTTTMPNRSTSSLHSRNINTPSLSGVSPRPDRSKTPPSARRMNSNFAAKPHEPHFAIQPDMLVCPTLLPGALDTLEAAAVQTFGLSPDAITESAARAIAEAAIHLADDAHARRPSRTNTLRGSMTSSTVLNPAASDKPVVVILAGNHSLGARALAAARHLVTRGYQVISAETIYSDIEAVDPQRRAQISILRKMRAGGASIKRGRWPRASGYIKQLSGPPAVIIDALLAGTTYEALAAASSSTDADPTPAQIEVREMIDWANRSRASVLSIACPSGVDGVSGATTTVDGEPLAIRPERVLALAAPLPGLLKAVEAGESWPLALADIGANIALRAEETVPFAGRWVVELTFVEGQ